MSHSCHSKHDNRSKMYDWYSDRVERREWCKLASPLGYRTQPWLSPASESSQPLRFRATRASTPDLDVDCESCVVPDSPNLSNEKKSARRMPRTTSDTSDTSNEQQQAQRKFTTRVRGPFHQSITAILTEEKREEKQFTKPTHVAVYLFRDLDRDRSRL